MISEVISEFPLFMHRTSVLQSIHCEVIAEVIPQIIPQIIS